MVEPQRPELTTIAGEMSMACLDFPFDGPRSDRRLFGSGGVRIRCLADRR